MGWFDKLLGNDFGSSYRYGEGDEYPRLQYAPRQSSGGWHGPNIFDVSCFVFFGPCTSPALISCSGGSGDLQTQCLEQRHNLRDRFYL